MGVGVGNAVITVDDTADLDDAATKIHMSKTLDLAASCSSDNSVILVDSIYEPMLERLKAKGGYLCNAEEKEKLRNTIWDDEGHLNTAIVAQPAQKIASMAGLTFPQPPSFISLLKKVGAKTSLSLAKNSPCHGALSREQHRSCH